MLLARFAAPGNIVETSPDVLESWSVVVVGIFNDVAAEFPRFYNPTIDESPDDHRRHDVTWPAFPGDLLSQRIAQRERWERADSARQFQDEYCEWSVLRDAGRITRVTFTSETPGYYDHLMTHDPELLLRLYAQAIGRTATLAELQDDFGNYKPDNALNNGTDGAIVHLAQDDNTLGAAVRLAGTATILREDENGPVTHPQSLVRCGGLGVATRHSDPRIAAAVNNLVADGFDVTLGDPPGLYLDRFVTTGFETPDDADAADFWTVERGEPGHVVRARFEVPPDRDYTVSDISIGGRPIEFGSQLAERLHVRVTAMAKPSSQVAVRQPCKS